MSQVVEITFTPNLTFNTYISLILWCRKYCPGQWAERLVLGLKRGATHIGKFPLHGRGMGEAGPQGEAGP